MAKRTYKARGSGYYPDQSALEGGSKDRRGKNLNTLQDYLANKADYVSVSMDPELPIEYGTVVEIPEINADRGRTVEFRVVDTGGAFKGKGFTRIDICTANRKESLDTTINGVLTLIFND
jgi:3D (Asp-Asp-Asp) domain-containing protein